MNVNSGMLYEFLAIICDIMGIPIAVWQSASEEKPVLIYPARKDGYYDHSCSDKNLRKQIENEFTQEFPMLWFEDEMVYFGICKGNDMIIAIGPAVRNEVNDAYQAMYEKFHAMRRSFPLKRQSLRTMNYFLSLIYCHMTGKSVSYDAISIRSHETDIGDWASEGDIETYQLEQSEYDRSHMSGMDYETRMIEIVKAGDLDGIKELMGSSFPTLETVGKVADNERKQAEYLTVSLITLLTRASIEGGLRSEVAHELGDVYLNQLEKASARGEAFIMVGLRAMYEFTEQVSLARRERSRQSYIEACKDYIAKHLRKNLTVGEIGPAIGVSRTYLAHKFREVEGITVQKYIQREKCRHAANLLKYSDYPISLISEYFGFSSQSYFGICFREWFGMTPKDYRHANQTSSKAHK